MIVFTVTTSSGKTHKYRETDYILSRYGTTDILGKRFQVTLDDNEVVKVYCYRIKAEDFRYDTELPPSKYEWIVESLYKFGKIITLKEQKKQREKKLSML